MSDSATTLHTLLSHVAHKPVPLVRFARLLLAKGQAEQALELCARVVAMTPRDAEVRALAAEVFSHGVDQNLFSLVRNSVRNKIYETAFRRAIRSDTRVLDIGAGTGLFAMMAARAGAAEVITCESNLAVAEVVSQIVARNGFADRVRVVAKHSSDLEIGVDLNGPADVIIWDNLSITLIGAGVLPTLEQAVRRLVRPEGHVIPAKGAIRVALAEDLKAQEMGIVEGFDLSPFNRLAAPHYWVQHRGRVVLRSEPCDLFNFDFTSGGPFQEARVAATIPGSGGRVNGVAQWVYLEIDEKERHEYPPVKQTSMSGVMFYPIMRPLETLPGNTVTVAGAHDRWSVRIWVEDQEARR